MTKNSYTLVSEPLYNYSTMPTNLYVLVPALWNSYGIKATTRLHRFWYGANGGFNDDEVTFQHEVTGVRRHSLGAFLNPYNYDSVAYIMSLHKARIRRFYHINENG